MKHLFILSLCAALCTFLSCKDDNNEPTLTYEEQLAIDLKAIDAYLAEKNITAQTTTSGLRYLITSPGDSIIVNPGATSVVTVRYKGYFLNGDVFDETKGLDVSQFNVSGVVPGFGEGLQLLNKNGKGSFFIPSGLGYGRFGSGPIDPNTPIIFDIELVDFF